MEQDQISQLPEVLKQQILSYLPLTQAARTSILSSSWKDSWLTIPSFRIGQDFFYQIDGPYNNDYDSIINHQNYIFQIFKRIFITRIKKDRNLLLEQLEIDVPRFPYNEVSSKISTFIPTILFILKVKKFKFSYGNYREFHRFVTEEINRNFPVLLICLDSWKYITDLALECCTIKSRIQTTWYALSTLVLAFVNLHDQQSLDSLTCNCTQLQILKIGHCFGALHSLNALHLERLVELCILHDNSFKKIELNSVFLQELCYENISQSRNEANGCVIHGISISKSLTSLIIHNNMAITFQWFDQIKNALSHITHLFLDGCHTSLKCIRVSSGSLRCIGIGIQGFEELDIVDASKLQKLILRCWDSSPKTPSLKLNNVIGQDLIYVKVIFSAPVTGFGYHQVINYLGMFRSTKRLEIQFKQGVFVPTDIREGLIPPFLGVKDLIFLDKSTYRIGSVPTLYVIFDNVLWFTWRPQTIIIQMIRLMMTIKLELEYKEEDERTDKSWQGCLDKVKVVECKCSSIISTDVKNEIAQFFTIATNTGNNVEIIFLDD